MQWDKWMSPEEERKMSEICKFTFPRRLNSESIEAQLALAIRATESVYGQPRVRMGTGYLFSEDHSELAIDVSTEVGEHVAQVFTGLLAWQLGEDEFTVERVSKSVTTT
jgi:hypothetical protein